MRKTGHRIKNEELDSYVKREATRNIKRIGGFMAIFVGLMFMFTYSYHVHGIIMLPLTSMLSVIVLFIYLFSFNQIGNIAKKTTFFVTATKVEKLVAKGELNLANQFAQARNEARYGIKSDQSFPVSEIESTVIKPYEIVIKNYDYNILNGNGKIVIPKEINDFYVVKQFITENATKFKLQS
ncbi:hypothetical protein [Kordia sp.]|uniref:hypothetical protein n=1 Tax=Kordia sp. TaxID=1965332 RepID=UPI003D2C7FA7